MGEAAGACLQEVDTVLGRMYIARDPTHPLGRLLDLLRVMGSAGIAVALTILTHPGRARDLQDGKGLADMMTTRRDVAAVLMAMTTEVDLAVGGTILDKLLRAKCN